MHSGVIAACNMIHVTWREYIWQRTWWMIYWGKASPPSRWRMDIPHAKWVLSKCAHRKGPFSVYLVVGKHYSAKMWGLCLLLFHMGMKDEDEEGALCWWNMRWRHDDSQMGKGSGQHTGVLWIHVLHAHDICTYSAIIDRVVKGWLFCHVVIRWQGCRHSDRLPLESENRGETQLTSCERSCDCRDNS